MKVLVVYYSMYGHILQLARAVEQGAKSVVGAEVMLRRVAEFEEVIKKTLPRHLLNKDTKYLINPTGRFVVGGPQAVSFAEQGLL